MVSGKRFDCLRNSDLLYWKKLYIKCKSFRRTERMECMEKIKSRKNLNFKLCAKIQIMTQFSIGECPFFVKLYSSVQVILLFCKKFTYPLILLFLKLNWGFFPEFPAYSLHPSLWNFVFYPIHFPYFFPLSAFERENKNNNIQKYRTENTKWLICFYGSFMHDRKAELPLSSQ